MADPSWRRLAFRTLGVVFGFGFLAVACSSSVDLGPSDWVADVEQRLAAAEVSTEVADCVLDVARFDLERNPLSEAATEELVRNCQAARVVIDAVDEEPTEQLALVDEPDTFGDDAALDGLWTACEQGSGLACDQLFAQAPIGSDYEDFGVSCGRRPDVLRCAELDLADDADQG